MYPICWTENNSGDIPNRNRSPMADETKHSMWSKFYKGTNVPISDSIDQSYQY